MIRKFFINCKTVEELKKEYKKLALKYHPDRPEGNAQIFVEMQAEYEETFKEIATWKDKSDCFINVINDLMVFADLIEVEIIGNWIWISGTTYPIKDTLNLLGCQWSKGKKKWYWTTDYFKKSKYKQKTIQELRDTYGSEVMVKNGTKTPCIAG